MIDYSCCEHNRQDKSYKNFYHINKLNGILKQPNNLLPELKICKVTVGYFYWSRTLHVFSTAPRVCSQFHVIGGPALAADLSV